MKTAYLIALICSVSCVLSAGVSADPSGSGQNLDTVRQKFAAFNRHDAAAIQDIYATDAVLHSPDYPALTGNAKIADTYRGIFAGVPDAVDEVQNLDAVGDRVYAQFILTGHFQGVADKPVNVRIMSIYTVKDGHITEDETYYDRKPPAPAQPQHSGI